MSFANSSQAVAHLRSSTPMAVRSDMALLHKLGYELTSDVDLPKSVAMAMFIDAGEAAILGVYPLPGSEAQQELVLELCSDLGIDVPEMATRRVSSAWIAHFIAHSRANLLEDLDLQRGDIVDVTDQIWSQRMKVSSIGLDGRVYFRIRGSARPIQIVKVAQVRTEHDRHVAP